MDVRSREISGRVWRLEYVKPFEALRHLFCCGATIALARRLAPAKSSGAQRDRRTAIQGAGWACSCQGTAKFAISALSVLASGGGRLKS
jgi:hypothetical protein